MDTSSNDRENQIAELIEEIESNFNFGIKDAVKCYDTVDDVIRSVLEDWGFIYKKEAYDWLVEHDYDIDNYMEQGALSDCTSLLELINRVYFQLAEEELLSLKDRIQDLIDLYWNLEDDDEDDDEIE